MLSEVDYLDNFTTFNLSIVQNDAIGTNFTGCQPKTFKTFILMVKPLKPLFFSEKPLKTFIFLRKTFIFRKSCFFSVFRVPRSYKILNFQQYPILSYILSLCLTFQGI